ncbi:hypothetical protein PENTCL1PPCAC_2506, partial [Pristionchus entomophagus]
VNEMKILRRSNGKAVVISIDNVHDFTKYVLHSSSPVLVYFWADSNGISRLIGSRLEEKVASRCGDIVMVSVNIDWAGEVALEWNVSVVPLIINFKNGSNGSRIMVKGNTSDEELSSFIENAC